MTTETPSWIESFLLELLRTPTQVPLGETEVRPGDPRIVRAVENVLLPRIVELGPDELRRHDKGDVAARFGPDSDDGVLIQTYIVSQHANLGGDPGTSRLADGSEFGVEGVCAVGQGATQNKGPITAAFAALREMDSALRRPVWLAVNTEGRSSHEGSTRVLDDLGVKAAYGIVAFGTDMRVSLGNRGRVDIGIRVKGESCHSSQPWLGQNPIEIAADVVARLRSTPLPTQHPVLGRASATPYRFSCYPVAPHTIPSEVRIVVDRRLLPGEDPLQATDGLRRHLSRWSAELDVEPEESMLPAEVDPDAPVVGALLEGLKAEGRRPETFWSANTFDAGYACSKGVPTPMFGPGKRGFAGAGLTGVDMIPVSECATAARVIRHALSDLCGRR
jgi:acetylornithine deacetylase/succinyl-diaminopimelate desuccinylase-like protein